MEGNEQGSSGGVTRPYDFTEGLGAGMQGAPSQRPAGYRKGDPDGTAYELQKDGTTRVTLPNGTIHVRAPESAKFLTKAEITKADDSGYEDVEVPEWGGWVRVKKISAAERGKIEAQQVRIKGDGSQEWDGSQLRELFCIAAIIDPETGVRMYNDKERALLSSKSAAGVDKVYEVATRLARVSKKDLEELAGNSDGDLSADSAGGTANG